MSFTPSIAGIRFFKHEQVIPAHTWNIFHGFGKNPSVDVTVEIDGQMQKVFPVSITYPDTDNVVVTWSADRIGFAALASTLDI